MNLETAAFVSIRPASFQIVTSSSFLYRSTLFRPIQPTPRVLAELGPASRPGDLSGRMCPHTGPAVREQLGVLVRARVAQSVFELLVRHMEAVGLRCDGDVDSARDAACLLQLAGFANICVARRFTVS